METKNFLTDKKSLIENFNKGKFQKVTKLGKKILKKKNNDFQILYALAISFLSLKDYLQAEKYFKHVVSLKPNAENYYIYGNINKQLNNYEEASKNFSKAINLKHDFSEAYNNLGNTKLKLGVITEAIENYKKAIEADKKNIQAYYNLAHVYHEEKKFDELKNVYQEVLNIDANNTTALNDLGYLNLMLGNIDEGRKLFERVIDIDENHIRAFKNYFLITKVSNGNKFLKKLEKINLANASNEDKIFAYISLSKCYFDLNQSEIAIKYLEESNKIKKKHLPLALKLKDNFLKK